MELSGKILELILKRMEKKNPRPTVIRRDGVSRIPDIIGAFPPTMLVTSDADFLKRDSYAFSKALTDNGIENQLINMGEGKKLTHAFTVMHTDYPESAAVWEHADRWFRNHMW